MDTKDKTTMSVMEMGQILGLKKTDAYWLVHKQCFETTLVQGVMRVNINSFEQAVRWDLMMRNPADYATVPKSSKKQREIWNAETLMKAVEVCKDPKLRLAINLAFACSLRIGELLGLTWSCIDISDESIHNGAAYVYVNKELQRVERSAMQQLDDKDILLIMLW